MIVTILQLQSIDVFKYLNGHKTDRASGLLDCDLNDRTRNNDASFQSMQLPITVPIHAVAHHCAQSMQLPITVPKPCSCSSTVPNPCSCPSTVPNPCSCPSTVPNPCSCPTLHVAESIHLPNTIFKSMQLFNGDVQSMQLPNAIAKSMQLFNGVAQSIQLPNAVAQSMQLPNDLECSIKLKGIQQNSELVQEPPG